MIWTGSALPPRASLWDNGEDAIEGLRTALRVREIGLSKFGVDNLRDGATLAELEDVLVPLMLHHRYQLDAALKLVGGVDYRHAVKGDGQPVPRRVAAARQRHAVEVVLGTLDVSRLTPPARGLELER